jgi:phosphoglucomutase
VNRRFGKPLYTRIDNPSTPDQKDKLIKLSRDSVKATTLAGEEIVDKLTEASGNGKSIEGLKVTTQNGWFAARPSGTENIYKLYAESFLGEEHLRKILNEAKDLIVETLK